MHDFSFGFNSPFAVLLSDGESIMVNEVIRLIPRKRLVAFGIWQDKDVVVKFFYSKSKAKRHIDKEVNGIHILQNNKIPTPKLYHQGVSADGSIHILIFERILNAKNVDLLWKNRKDIESVRPYFQALIIEIATQHVLGVLQKDLHLKNFLIGHKIIYTLDGADIETYPHLLSKAMSMDNLALFLAQLGVGTHIFQEKLFRYYAKSRGWLLKKSDLIELFLTIKKWDQLRWREYSKKIFRQCSDFSVIDTPSTFSVYDRTVESKECLGFIHNPDRIFKDPVTVPLKLGRSSTVVRTRLNGSEVVVKRYNFKNNWHRLRRLFRTTRAKHCWQVAQKMQLFGVKTAKPIAFIEKKWLGFTYQSYYVTEYVAGESALDWLIQHEKNPDHLYMMIEKILNLIKNFSKLQMTHGDLKITNILIDQDDNPVLIDLDGAISHISIASLRHAFKKEMKRFLENFKDYPQLEAKIKAVIHQKPL